jgi:large subunit ribosomal protein L23
MSKAITLRPRLSEKTYGLSESRVYVVEIDKDINKHTVARAIESQFEVKVVKVNIANVKGKSKRIVSLSGKRMVNAEGKRNDIKKAYVTLAEGYGLPFFEAIEEEEQKEDNVQQQIDKAAAKQAAKDDKKAAKKAPKAKKTTVETEEASAPVAEQPKARRGWRLPRRKTKAEREAERNK